MTRRVFCRCECCADVCPGSVSSAPVPFLAGFIQDPGVGEGGLPGLLRLLLILVHGALVDVAQQVQEVAHQGAFTCVHMTCRTGSFKSVKKQSGRGQMRLSRIKEECNTADKKGRKQRR